MGLSPLAMRASAAQSGIAPKGEEDNMMVTRESQEWIVRCDVCQRELANLGSAAKLQNAPTYEAETERLGPLTGQIVCDKHAFDHNTGEWIK